MKLKKPLIEITYEPDTQELFLNALIGNPDLFILCDGILKADYWDSDQRKLADFVINYYRENHSAPKPEIIKAYTGQSLEPTKYNQQDLDFFKVQIEQFCRHKELEILIYDGMDLLKAGKYGEIEARAKGAMMISLNTDLGLRYFDKPGDRLRRMRDKSPKRSFGWTALDKVLFGGTTVGELNLFSGIPNAGKSLVLQNLALNWVEMGLNVAFVTLEMLQDPVALRLDAMNSGFGTREVMQNIDETELRIMMKRKGKKFGELFIKKLPESNTTVNNVRGYLQEVLTRTDIRINALLVDYLDLLKPIDPRINPSDVWAKDKAVSEELRALGAPEDWNLVQGTASQLNRSGVKEESFDFSHIAGGISKVNTADNMFALVSSPQTREAGTYRFQILKARDSNGAGKMIDLAYDPNSMRITDVDPALEKVRPHTINEIRGDLANKLNKLTRK